jgi:MGT family glycosyltransferase
MKVVFFPAGAYGPTNNCVGIGHVLRRRGHRVVFVLDESLAGTLEERGFEERVVGLQPPAAIDRGAVLRKSAIEQLEGFVRPGFEALVDGSKRVDDELREIFGELRPDAIVVDNVVGFPAVVTADCPWVRIVSRNPLELPDPDLPPAFSGYPADDRSGWDEFRTEHRRVLSDLHAGFDEFVRARGCPPLPELEFIHRSPYLNLYLLPEEVDYERARPLGAMWERLDSCVRAEPGEVDLPAGDAPLVYLSLGSLGSVDVELMQRLVDLLAAGGYRAIVSKGPRHELIELREGQTGAELVPQPALLPAVDAVITHGGNNTVIECLHFGKPMVLLPLFWDQHDNARRMHELGLGERLPTFEFEDAQLGEATERLLADAALAGRLEAISKRLQANPGTERAADWVESVFESEARAWARA